MGKKVWELEGRHPGDPQTTYGMTERLWFLRRRYWSLGNQVDTSHSTPLREKRRRILDRKSRR